jgi:hypothetical protein
MCALFISFFKQAMNELEPFQNEDKLSRERGRANTEMRSGSRGAVGAVKRAASQLASAAWRAPESSQPHVRGCMLQRLHTASSRACGSHGGVRRASSGAKSMKRYSKLEDKDVAFFEQVLGKSGVITDRDDLLPYNTDWMKKYHGQSKLALRPKTTEQVAQILKYCNERVLAVVPQGGNTGLVGGSVPVSDEIGTKFSNSQKVNAGLYIVDIVPCIVDIVPYSIYY